MSLRLLNSAFLDLKQEYSWHVFQILTDYSPKSKI